MTDTRQLNTFHHGYEIIATDESAAWFVGADELTVFEAKTDIEESALFWRAASNETVKFFGKEWTVGFLLPYPGDASPHTNELTLTS
jgi:hypothetical protein